MINRNCSRKQEENYSSSMKSAKNLQNAKRSYNKPKSARLTPYDGNDLYSGKEICYLSQKSNAIMKSLRCTSKTSPKFVLDRNKVTRRNLVNKCIKSLSKIKL